jgi:hypothetical protein
MGNSKLGARRLHAVPVFVVPGKDAESRFGATSQMSPGMKERERERERERESVRTRALARERENRETERASECERAHSRSEIRVEATSRISSLTSPPLMSSDRSSA